MGLHRRVSHLAAFAAFVGLTSAAVMPAADAASDEPGSVANTAATTAVPDVLGGGTWVRHLSEDLMPYWDSPAALGEPVGNFPTFLGRSGEVLPENTTRGLVALSRRVYGYSVAFMLTGNAKYLTYAKAGLGWIETHAADPVHGGYFGQLDVNGDPLNRLANKDASDLAAVGLAYGMYFNVTRDPAAEAGLLAVRDLLFDKYYDAAGNRLRDAVTYDLATEVDTGNNGGDITNYVQAVTSIYLANTPLLTDPARRAQFRSDTRKLTQSLIDNFKSTTAANPWWFWGRTKRFGNFNALETTFGHNLKSYALIANANRMFPDRPWDNLAADRTTLITRAWDDLASRWNQQLVSFAPGNVERDSAWWMHDEADQLLATLDLDGGFTNTSQLARSAQSFLDIYVDREDPARETFSRVIRTGNTTEELRKSHLGKSMLHNFEHALVMYLHGRALEGLPARLFYAFPAEQALTATAKPYWFDATGETRTVGAPLENLPGHSVVEVDFTGLDRVPRPPYPTPDDTTAPVTTATVTPSPNAQGWNRDDVSVSLHATDDLVGVKEIHATVEDAGGAARAVGYIDPGEAFTLPALTAETDFDVTYFAVDAIGNAEAPQTLHVRVDKTGPTVTIDDPGNGASYLLDQVTPSQFACEDDATGSGLLSCAGVVPTGTQADTSTVGVHTFTVMGTDRAGNQTVLTHEYAVRYAFTGFLSPIDNRPVVNVANAGRTIPVKWRLQNADGMGVSDRSSFVSLTSAAGECAGTANTDVVDTYADQSGLQYLGDGYWQFNWKTPKAYAGQCRVLHLNLADTTDVEPARLAGLGRTATISFE